MASSGEIGALFEDIDSDHNGFITRLVLEDYVAKHPELPESTVGDWFLWFDMDGTGKITYEEMCVTLGIGMTKNYTEKVEQKREMIRRGKIAPPKDMPNNAPKPHPGLLDDVTILYQGQSDPGLLEAIVTIVKEKCGNFGINQESRMARLLKDEIELKWGKHWQVVVSRTTFGCAVGHEENFFIHFKYKDNLFIIYRTTD